MRIPELEGHVAIPPTTFKGPFTPVQWPVKFTHPGLTRHGGRPNPNWETNITSVRVRRQDGVQREARLEGDIVGGSISLGDDISLWGADVRGTLIADCAYNHNTKAEIRVRHAYNLTIDWIKSIVIIILISSCALCGIISLLASVGHH